MNRRPSDRCDDPDEDPEVEAWIQRQLDKPGGHGPLPLEAQNVIAAVLANQPKKIPADRRE